MSLESFISILPFYIYSAKSSNLLLFYVAIVTSYLFFLPFFQNRKSPHLVILNFNICDQRKDWLFPNVLRDSYYSLSQIMSLKTFLD